MEQEDRTGALISRPEHVRYFTGWSHEYPAYFLLTASSSMLIAVDDPSLTVDLEAIGIELVPYVAYSAATLPDPQAAADDRLESVVGTKLRHGAFELDHLRFGMWRRLGFDEQVDLAPVIRRWRRVKDLTEVAAIRSTIRALEDSFAAVRQIVQPGISEATLVGVVYEQLVAYQRGPLRLGFVIAAGPRSAEVDPRASHIPLRDGEMVIVDLYPVLDGYAADLTRTFVVGGPSPLFVERHRVVEAALREAERHLRPGVAVAEIDRELRRALPENDGLRASMRHHSGHGLGLSEWEEPWIGPDTPGTLVEGDVVAIEPGVYVPGWGGVRLESNYHITSSGFSRLDTTTLGIQG